MRTTTSSQTIGPFWHLLQDGSWADLTRFGAAGAVITLKGRVLDGAGAAMGDACVEIWQTSPAMGEDFPGFGRAATDAEGFYRFTTIMPEAVAGPGNMPQAPHVAVTIFARGLLFQLCTRIYFEGMAGNEDDPVLNLVAPGRRGTLLARAAAPGVWELDFHTQGALETVFFDI